jgi:hypothetical protein
MRNRLMAAAAIAPLAFCGLEARAQTLTISSNTSTPVATATAVNNAPADIVFSSGTFTINSATPAFTLNSNNAISSAGTIGSKNIDGATAILVQGPFSGSVTNSGSISLTEDYTASDSANSDGITEAPYAQGNNRYGIRITGPFTGNVLNSGTISIQGNNSSDISIEGKLIGSLSSTGAIEIVGDNNVALRVAGEVTRGVQISNTINVKGQNSTAVQTSAPIDGSLSVYSSIQTTGYAVSSRQTTTTVRQKIQATPADVQQGGSAIKVGANVLGGIFIGGAPSTTVLTDTTTDADGDGIVDSVEGTGVLTTLGSAPALQIGAATPITIGNFGTFNTNISDNQFGLIVRGNISGQGLNDGVTGTAIDIGAGGGGVNLTGGINVLGTVSAAAYEANATAVHLENGVTGTTFRNSGVVNATVTSAGTSLATALQIDSGARITNFVNYGTVSAVITGNQASATAVVDKTGAISSVFNAGYVVATLNPALAGETVTGRGIAFDLSANTSGINFTQQLNGSVAPAIVGDVLLGSGVNTVNLMSGSLLGSLSLGGAAGSSLTIDNGASYKGALTYSGNALAINVANGTLQDNSATTVGASSLTVGGSSSLIVALDPTSNRSTLFNVSGAASIASGAKIGATLLSEPSQAGQTFTIVKAGSLAVGATDSSLLTALPYLFDGSLKTDAAAKTLSITVRTKTTAEMGMNKAEASAFPAIYAALPQDTGIQTSIITAPTRETLIHNYDQLLPNSSGDVFQTAFNMSRSVSRASADRFDTIAHLEEDETVDDLVTSGFWASEFYSGIDQQKAENNAYHSAALGIIGGYDFGGTGITMSLSSSNVTRPHTIGDSLNAVSRFEGGFYASPRFGPFSIDARVAGGYIHATNRRQLVASIVSGDLSTTSTVTRTADGDWQGYDISAHLGAGLQWNVNKRLFFQPKVYGDVFHMHENAYTERNGGAGFDYNVSARSGTQTNATASLVTGLKFGNTFVVSPQLEIGYDSVLNGGPGATTARFAYGGPTFSVVANQPGGAAMARLTLRGDGNYVHFSLQAGGEFNDTYRAMDAKAVFRMSF